MSSAHMIGLSRRPSTPLPALRLLAVAPRLQRRLRALAPTPIARRLRLTTYAEDI